MAQERKRARNSTALSQSFVRTVELREDRQGQANTFPWSIPAIRSLGTLDLHAHVTFFIGENGSGKSTLLEGIADAAGFGEAGGSKHFRSSGPDYWSALGAALKLSRGIQRERDAFFLRAESFFNVASRIEELAEIDPSALAPYGDLPPTTDHMAKPS